MEKRLNPVIFSFAEICPVGRFMRGEKGKTRQLAKGTWKIWFRGFTIEKCFINVGIFIFPENNEDLIFATIFSNPRHWTLFRGNMWKAHICVDNAPETSLRFLTKKYCCQISETEHLKFFSSHQRFKEFWKSVSGNPALQCYFFGCRAQTGFSLCDAPKQKSGCDPVAPRLIFNPTPKSSHPELRAPV